MYVINFDKNMLFKNQFQNLLFFYVIKFEYYHFFNFHILQKIYISVFQALFFLQKCVQNTSNLSRGCSFLKGKKYRLMIFIFNFNLL